MRELDCIQLGVRKQITIFRTPYILFSSRMLFLHLNDKIRDSRCELIYSITKVTFKIAA